MTLGDKIINVDTVHPGYRPFLTNVYNFQLEACDFINALIGSLLLTDARGE